MDNPWMVRTEDGAFAFKGDLQACKYFCEHTWPGCNLDSNPAIPGNQLVVIASNGVVVARIDEKTTLLAR